MEGSQLHPYSILCGFMGALSRDLSRHRKLPCPILLSLPDIFATFVHISCLSQDLGIPPRHSRTHDHH